MPAAKIVVCGLGGTIAMSGRVPGGGVTPTATTDDLVRAVPGLRERGLDVEAVTVRNRPGAALTFEDLADLARRCRGTSRAVPRASW
jgi:L-asparaginase